MTAKRQLALDEIAARLREAREYRHLTLKAVALATKIPAHHIEALEQGNLAAMPGRAYSRAFLRTYASYLGLDADALLELLPAPSIPPQSGFPPPLWRPGIGWIFVSL